MAFIESLDKCVVIELRAAADMDECCTGREPSKELGIKEAARLVGERQEADENVGRAQQSVETVPAA